MSGVRPVVRSRHEEGILLQALSKPDLHARVSFRQRLTIRNRSYHSSHDRRVSLIDASAISRDHQRITINTCECGEAATARIPAVHEWACATCASDFWRGAVAYSTHASERARIIAAQPIAPDDLTTVLEEMAVIQATGADRAAPQRRTRREFRLFTPSEIREVRRLRREQGLTYGDLANLFNTSRPHIHRIITRKLWGYVTDEAPTGPPTALAH